jgi:hypothetical protein
MIKTLTAIRNFKASEAFEITPWDKTQGAGIHQRFGGDKKAFEKWEEDPTTDHIFFSGFEGEDPNKRISGRKNPAHRLNAIVVDVDEVIPEERLMDWVQLQRVKPAYISNTFSSKWRMIYELDTPFPEQECGWKAFLQTAKRELDLLSLSTEIDDAFERPSQYYELGRDWRKVSEDIIPTYTLQEWALKASETKKKVSSSTSVGSLDAINGLLRRIYPGRWQGEFKVGARGVRFWEPAADNPTAAVVTATGMRCFTGDKDFLTWREIFGEAAMDEIEGKFFEKLLCDIWFDGKDYWRKSGEDRYTNFNRQDTQLYLMNRHDLAATPKGTSPVDKALLFIQAHKRVEGVAPFLFKPTGVLIFNKDRYLNNSRVKPVRPSKEPKEWAEDFPYIAGFYDRLLQGEDRLAMFAWIRHFYSGALAEQPNQGHTMILVGGVGTGKNFHDEMIIGKLMGGSVDAGPFITGDDSYNSHYLSAPLLRVDDEAGLEDRKAKRKFIAQLKKLTANRLFTVSEKYVKNSLTEWMGRVMVTLNPDGESLALLPSLDQGNADKTCFIRTQDDQMPHPPGNIENIIDEELPNFGRWLLDWEPPERLEPGGRFGFKAYHNPELFQESELNSDGAQFEELLILYAKQDALENEWEGSATQLHAEICGNSNLSQQLRGYTPNYVGRQLGKLLTRDYIEKLHRGRTRGWRLDLTKLRGGD